MYEANNHLLITLITCSIVHNPSLLSYTNYYIQYMYIYIYSVILHKIS